MRRSVRIGLFALLLVGVIGGSVWAANSPHTKQTPQNQAGSHEPEASPAADELARAVDRLKAQGINSTVAQLGDLAGTYGLGGAVRLVAWADASGKSLAELRALRDGGQGWGQMARDLGLSPGIGWIMGGGHADGHGNAGAHGPDADESAEESPGT